MRPYQSQVPLLRNVIYKVLEDHELELHKSDLERVKDDIYLANILKHTSNVGVAATLTVNRCLARRHFGIDDKIYNAEQDNLYSKAIKPVGKDIEGNTLLFIDMTEIDKLIDINEEEQDHLLYWLERMERRIVSGNISIALHHGSEKSTDRFNSFITLIDDLVRKVYPNLIQTLFVVYDFMKDKFIRNVKFNLHFICENTYDTYFVLDNKFYWSDGSLKNNKKNPKAFHNIQKIVDMQKIVAALKDNNEVKSGTELTGAIGNNQDQINMKQELNSLLAKAHDIQNQVSQLNQDIRKLIECVSGK